MLTSFEDLARIGGGILSILAGVDFMLSLEGLCSADWILGVNLAAIFLLRILNLLSVCNVSQLDSYMDEIKFHTTLPILSKSFKSFTFAGSTCLLKIYLAMNFKESLILLVSDAICSMKPWREIG